MQWLSIWQGSHHMSQQVSSISVCYCRRCVEHSWVHEYISLQQEYILSYCALWPFWLKLVCQSVLFRFFRVGRWHFWDSPQATLQIWQKSVLSPNGSSRERSGRADYTNLQCFLVHIFSARQHGRNSVINANIIIWGFIFGRVHLWTCTAECANHDNKNWL